MRGLLAVCLWLPIVLVGASAGANTDDESQSQEPKREQGKQSLCDLDCVAVGQWSFNLAMGMGLRSNPVLNQDDTPLLVLPELSYYGKRFFLKNFDLGFTLLETRRHQLNWLLLPSRDQMYFNRWDPLNFIDSGGPSAGASSGPSFSDNGGMTPPVIGEGAQSLYVDVRSDFVQTPSEGQASSQSSSVADGVEGSVSSVSSSASSESSSASYRSEAFDAQVSDFRDLVVNGQRVNLNDVLAGDVFQAGNITVSASSSDIVINNIVAGDSIELVARDWQFIQERANVSSGNVLSIDADIASIRLLDLAADVADEGVGGEAEEPVLDLSSMRERRAAVLTGLEYSLGSEGLNLHMQALQDVSGRHTGHELRAALTLPLNLSRQRFALTYGLNFQSAAVLRYFYGLDQRDGVDPAYYYDPGSGVSQMLRLDWQKNLSRRWSLRAMLQVTQLAETIADSPIVEESQTQSVFFGGVYHF